VAALGFADVGAYLLDRVVQQAWLLADVAAELAAHRLTVRRLLDRHGIRRVRRTPAERAAAEAGLQVQAVSWQARRAGRLAELGFADLAGYLKARHVAQGVVGEADAGRAWGWPPVAGGGAGPAGAATLTWSRSRRAYQLHRFESLAGRSTEETGRGPALDPRADRRWRY
jgi:hypothetical protein